jgi:hypothetical protein
MCCGILLRTFYFLQIKVLLHGVPVPGEVVTITISKWGHEVRRELTTNIMGEACLSVDSLNNGDCILTIVC